jgi:photosystem II stability/assembly factor-like uncharacterized protein
VHVHGIGVDPADDSLFIATHTGLWRVAPEETEALRVGDRKQDTMGFAIVGPNHFLGSGHPDLRDALPPHLGLIESTDAGASWETVSLLGQADFHVLRRAGEHVYGYDASNDRLLVSNDRGRSWREFAKPGPVLDLAVSPAAPMHIVLAAGGARPGLFESRNGGRSWTRVADTLGYLGWPARKTLLLAGPDGVLRVSTDAGRSFVQRGEIGGEPAALLANGTDEVYVALHDGTIRRSSDGGTNWSVRTTP